jgi:N-acetylglucosaminyldiphosphoundecaprenol N-acetyl-beta-D-mannosaminyltransferase
MALEGIPLDKPLLGVSVRDIPRLPHLQEKVFAALAATLDRMIKDYGYRPVFLLLHCPEDLEFANRVTNLMAGQAQTIFRVCRPDEMIAIITRLDLLIGMRLHALIFAATHSIPALGLSYDPKVASFMRSIRQPFIPLDKHFSDEELNKKLQGLIDNKEAVKLALDVTGVELYHKAEINFSLLESLVNENQKIVDFAGVEVDNVTIAEAMQRFESFIQSTSKLIVTPNPEMIVASQHDRELRRILNSADLRIPDGISLVVVSRILGKPLKERVTGIDLLYKIAELSAQKGYRIFLLGSAPGTAQAAADNLVKLYPGLKLSGVSDGYFKPADEPALINKIKQSRTDILFVGLGAGRQEKWLDLHLKELNIRVGMCIGGSLDVISGLKKRAPLWIQKLYIEWLYRLITEPQRWKRQLALPKFLWLMFFGRKDKY